MRGAIGSAQVEAKRKEAAFTRQFERIRVGAEAGDPDRGMRLLKRLQMMLERAHHRIWNVDLPVLPGLLIATVTCPDVEDHVERFARHVAIFTLHAIDAEQLP